VTPSDRASCPACNEAAATAVGNRGALHLVRCNQCTLIYSSPPPIAAVREKYLAEYDLAAHFAEWEPRKRLLYDRRLRALAAPAPDRRRLCDVGSGDGQFLQVAAESGWQPFGIELNPPAARRCRERGFDVAEGTIEELDDLPWQSFDVVTSWDVLEHTPTPREFVRRIRRLVKNDGRVVITTLNVASLAYYVYGLEWSMVCDDHFTYWNKRSLCTLVESEGFRVSSCTTFGLGRDFVSFLDRGNGQAPVATTGAGAPVRRWDVNGVVVGAENMLNALLRVVGAGVGISVTLRPR
jgi:SAM-dependent methyltransferase